MAIDKEKILAGGKAVEDYREAHRKLHSKPWHKGVPSEHEAIMQQLTEALKVIGFGSLQEYEASVQDYLENGEAIYREAPLPVVGLIAPSIGLGATLPNDALRFSHYTFTASNPRNKRYDITFAVERESNEVIATGYEDADIGADVDLEFCGKNDVVVTQHTFFGGRKNTFFYNKGTGSLNICLDKSETYNGRSMSRLLRLSVVDTCLDFGIQGESIENDVLIKGKKVAGSIFNDLRERNEQGWSSGARDAFLATIIVNHDYDVALAQGALLNPKRPASEITSFSGELGYKVDPQEFKDRFLANVAKRFNLIIEEEEP